MGASPHILALRAKIGNDLICAPSVSAAIFDDRGRLLMARDPRLEAWVTVGGMIDPHESPAQAAVRETFEETGLETRPVRVFGVFGGPHNEIVYENGDRVSFTAIGFVMEPVGGTLKADGEEIERLDWISEDQVDGLEMSPLAHEIVRGAFAENRAQGTAGAYFAWPERTD